MHMQCFSNLILAQPDADLFYHEDFVGLIPLRLCCVATCE